MMMRCIPSTVAFAVALAALPRAGAAQESLGPVDSASRPPIDVGAVQGILAIQRLDGWLLYDYQGQNPVAHEVVRPQRPTSRRWFVLIPARGEPVVLAHQADMQAFAGFPGRKVEYAGWRDLDLRLKELLKGKRRVAMEYSKAAALPQMSRVDAGTHERVRGLGPDIISSEDLLQTTRARWSAEGRASHYLAAHHLAAINRDALAFIGRQVAAGRKVTERQVQDRILAGMRTRGLQADAPPVVASGPNSADPAYPTPPEGSRAIVTGDVVILELAARQAGKPDAVHAELTWVAYVGSEVPARHAELFSIVARARDAAVALVTERVKAHRPVRGWEADRAARELVTKAGWGERFVHRTGHSIDTRRYGSGANLDDLETHDTRSLVTGTGFVVSPGIYLPGELGLRVATDCFVGAGGLEVTTPVQKAITPLLRPKGGAASDAELM